MDGIDLMTPSFADELFGKLLIELGESRFRERLQIRGGNPGIRQLVNQVLRIRLAETRKTAKDPA